MQYTLTQPGLSLSQKDLGIVPNRSSGGYVDGFLYCKFTKYITVDPSQPNWQLAPDLTLLYYFLMGAGPTHSTGKHGNLPLHWSLRFKTTHSSSKMWS